MRAGCLDLLDIENIAEELDALGRSDSRALDSHFKNLLVHLLKWQMQPWRRSNSWRNSIDNSRQAIAKLTADSPSLRPRLPLVIQNTYHDAVRQASLETRIPERYFPARCPYSMDQLLNKDFLPESRNLHCRGTLSANRAAPPPAAPARPEGSTCPR